MPVSPILAGSLFHPSNPSASVDSTIQTIFHVGSMAAVALQMIPGLPPGVQPIITTVIADMEKAYQAYKSNPTADLLEKIKDVMDQAFDDIAVAIHPSP